MSVGRNLIAPLRHVSTDHAIRQRVSGGASGARRRGWSAWRRSIFMYGRTDRGLRLLRLLRLELHRLENHRLIRKFGFAGREPVRAEHERQDVSVLLAA